MEPQSSKLRLSISFFPVWSKSNHAESNTHNPNKNKSSAVQTALIPLTAFQPVPLKVIMAINMLVTRARMSTLFALVKTHNYLIYISFPPQNRKPLCAAAPCLPLLLLRRQLESSSNQLPSCALWRERLSWVRLDSWTEADGEKAHGSGDAQAGSASPGQKVSLEPPQTAVIELCSQYRQVRICINSTNSWNVNTCHWFFDQLELFWNPESQIKITNTFRFCSKCASVFSLS